MGVNARTNSTRWPGSCLRGEYSTEVWKESSTVSRAIWRGYGVGRLYATTPSKAEAVNHLFAGQTLIPRHSDDNSAFCVLSQISVVTSWCETPKYSQVLTKAEGNETENVQRYSKQFSACCCKKTLHLA